MPDRPDPSALIDELAAVCSAASPADALAERAARMAGFGRALLTAAHEDAVVLGKHALSDEEVAYFSERARDVPVEERLANRRRIRALAWPGTAIAYVRRAASGGWNVLPTPAEGVPAGSWHPDDTVYVLVEDLAGADIGVLSLDLPDDGAAPSPRDLPRLERVALFLRLASGVLESLLAADQLRLSERRFDDVIGHLPVVLWMVDPRSERVVFVNDAYEVVWGRPVASLSACVSERSEHVHADDRERVLAAYSELTRGSQAVVRYRVVRPDGEVRFVRERTFATRDDQGRVTRIVSLVDDESTLVRAHTELARREERAGLILEQAADGIIVVDADEQLVEVNAAAQRMLGYSRDQLQAIPMEAIFGASIPTDDAQAHGDGGASRTQTCEVRRRDGSAFTASVTRTSLSDGSTLRVLRDVTLQHELAEVRRRLSRRLLEVRELEQQHIARELHDHLGQLLTAVKMSLQLARDPRFDSSLEDRLDHGIQTIDRAMDVVRGLSLDLRPPMLDDLGLESALDWFVSRARDRARCSVTVEVDLAGREPPETVGIAIYRVVQEAVTNALKHSSARRIAVRVERVGKTIVVGVRDDGCGFDAKLAKTAAARGEGLGLAGMRERAELLGGTLSLRSSAASGTRVRVEIPDASDVDAAAAASDPSD